MILFFPFHSKKGIRTFQRGAFWTRYNGDPNMRSSYDCFFHSVLATLYPTKQGTPTFKKGPYLTRYKEVPNMNSFLHQHEFWALRHSFIPKHIYQWFQNGNLKGVLHPDTYVSTRRFQIQAIYILQMDTSKGSCITCKNEIRQKSFAHHRLYIYASIKRSKMPIILSPWILSPISFRSWFIPLPTRL